MPPSGACELKPFREATKFAHWWQTRKAVGKGFESGAKDEIEFVIVGNAAAPFGKHAPTLFRCFRSDHNARLSSISRTVFDARQTLVEFGAS